LNKAALLIAPISLAMQTALACPTISGAYLSDADSSQKLIIEGSPTENPNSFNFKIKRSRKNALTWKIIVDNTPRKLNMGPNYKNVVSVANCIWDGVHEVVAGDYEKDSRKFKFTQEWRFYKSTDNQLIWESSYKDDSQNKPVFKIQTFRLVPDFESYSQ
jgi:hypothetical protein